MAILEYRVSDRDGCSDVFVVDEIGKYYLTFFRPYKTPDAQIPEISHIGIFDIDSGNLKLARERVTPRTLNMDSNLFNQKLTEWKKRVGELERETEKIEEDNVPLDSNNERRKKSIANYNKFCSEVSDFLSIF